MVARAQCALGRDVGGTVRLLVVTIVIAILISTHGVIIAIAVGCVMSRARGDGEVLRGVGAEKRQ